MYYHHLLAVGLLATLLFACYEERLGCLDPEASNYDLRADEACPDCCTFPVLTLRTQHTYAGEPLTVADTLTDGAGNQFRLLQLRYYLGGLELRTADDGFIVPGNFTEVGQLVAGDTVLTEFNANLMLAEFPGVSSRGVGAVATGLRELTTVGFNLGLGSVFADVIPTTAPASSPLAPQAGLLNFNDGQGYLLGSYEYVLLATADTVRVDLRGSRPVTVDFAQGLVPERGRGLTVELTAELESVFNTLNLRDDPDNQVATAVPALSESFFATITQ